MLIQEQSIKSLDLSELDFENANKPRTDEDDQLEPNTEEDIADADVRDEEKEEEEEEDRTNLAQKINLVQNAQKLKSARAGEEKTFDKVLDIMEVF